MMIREPMAAWSQGPRHLARRRVPSDAAVPGPGRRDVDRGRLCRRGLSRQIFRRAGRGLRPLRGDPQGADLNGCPQGQREQGERVCAERLPTTT